MEKLQVKIQQWLLRMLQKKEEEINIPSSSIDSKLYYWLLSKVNAIKGNLVPVAAL
jgi:hypothetical protein